jgi:spore maturation protein CgeB
LYEPARAEVVQKLIDSRIKVKLAGHKWRKYIAKNSTSPYLDYVGTKLTGNAYARLISSALFSLGCLSKRFPELHTTRTFEIPACATALLTERNEETTSYFDEDEVIFYDSLDDLINKLRYYEKNLIELQNLTYKGRQKVLNGGYDYTTIMRRLLKRILR